MFDPAFFFLRPRLGTLAVFCIGFAVRDLMEDDSKVRRELKAMLRRAKEFFKDGDTDKRAGQASDAKPAVEDKSTE